MSTHDSVERKILLLTDNFGGGTGRHIAAASVMWKARGWETLICCMGAVSEIPPDTPFIEISSSGWWDRFPISQMRRLHAFARLLQDTRPTVVHAYFFWPIIYARLLKRAGFIRVLIENREDMGFGWARTEYAFLRATAPLPDRVVCVSEGVKEKVAEMERLDPARVSVIRNGILLPEPGTPTTRAAARARLELPPESLVVGMVANLNRAVKGVDRFLEAIPLIRERVPAARFLIVGGGPDEGPLRERADGLGISDVVRFAGFRKDVDACYAAMDISVLTSLSEGLSITLLESMGHGLPVVVTAVGGNPEVVVEEETGFLVPPGDTARFADRVVRLARDAPLRERMGRAGRARVERDFCLEEVADRYLSLYTEVISNGGERGRIRNRARV